MRMADVLHQLRREHRDLEKLIAVLEQQAATAARGESADFNLMQSILQYLGNYPDLLHHPKEDLIYDRLKQRDPALAAGVSEIVEEHYTLEHMTRQLAGMVEARMRREAPPQDDMDAFAREFVGRYRRHIAVEEDELFPRALDVLDDSDWAAIDEAVSPDTDPLFDGAVAAQYQALHHEIMRFGT